MYIYKITNIVNNKVYIGQTIRPTEQRFKRHINDALNNILDTHFARAIRKYGRENFRIEIIEEANSADELNEREHYWINYYNSINEGYNETDALYKSGGNTYSSKTAKELQTISQKIALTKYGELNPNARQIKCLNVNTKEEIIFETLEKCRDFFNEKTHRFITTRVRHITKSLYKQEWNIAYINEPYPEVPIKANKTGRRLRVINMNDNNIFEFCSIRQASRELQINRSKINNFIKNNETEFIIDFYKFTILN